MSEALNQQPQSPDLPEWRLTPYSEKTNLRRHESNLRGLSARHIGHNDVESLVENVELGRSLVHGSFKDDGSLDTILATASVDAANKEREKAGMEKLRLADGFTPRTSRIKVTGFIRGERQRMDAANKEVLPKSAAKHEKRRAGRLDRRGRNRSSSPDLYLIERTYGSDNPVEEYIPATMLQEALTKNLQNRAGKQAEKSGMEAETPWWHDKEKLGVLGELYDKHYGPRHESATAHLTSADMAADPEETEKLKKRAVAEARESVTRAYGSGNGRRGGAHSRPHDTGHAPSPGTTMSDPAAAAPAGIGDQKPDKPSKATVSGENDRNDAISAEEAERRAQQLEISEAIARQQDLIGKHYTTQGGAEVEILKQESPAAGEPVYRIKTTSRDTASLRSNIGFRSMTSADLATFLKAN